MLSNLRDITRNWVARVFIGVIALMMAVTLFQGDFLSGITGLFNPPGLAQIGRQSITPAEVERDFSNFLRQRGQSGQPVSRPDALQANIPSQILEELIRERAAAAYAERLGVRISNNQVVGRLRSMQTVQDPITGRFDQDTYFRAVREMGFSPGEFESRLRRDLASNQMVVGMMAGFRAPSSFGALVLAVQSERRRVSLSQATVNDLPPLPAPTAGQLRDFYDDHRSAYALPEFRAVTLVFARTADFAARATIAEAAIRAEFDRRRESLTTPERRSFVAIAAPDEARARQAAERLARGEDPAAIARALSVQAQTQTDRRRADIPDRALAAAVFSAPAGAPARAVRTTLSPWTALAVRSVTPASAPSYETERERLRAELASQAGGEARDAALEAYEAARDGGTAIAEAARRAGLVAVVIPAVEAQGRGRNGAPIAEFAEAPQLLRAAFDTQEGEATDFAPAGEGVEALVSVDSITPPATRPFEEVRAVVEQQWRTQERGRQLRELGQAITAAVAGGQSFEAALRARNLRVLAANQMVDRASAMRQPDRQVAELLFSTNPGAVGVALRPDASALLIAHIEEVTRANPAQAREQVEQLRQQVNQQVGESVVEAISAAVIEAADVRRNPERLRQAFPAGPAEEEGS